MTALEAPRSRLRLVVTLRADFYDRPLQYQEWGPLLKQRTEVILPLNRMELTWANGTGTAVWGRPWKKT